MAIQPLLDALQQMHSLYEQLIDLGRKKKDQVIGNQLNELTQTLTHETRVLKSLASLDQVRIQALTAFQKDAGLKEDLSMQLEDIIKYCASIAHKQAIHSMMVDMTTQAQTLRELNKTNQTLVHHALDIVNHTLDLLVGSPEDEMIYLNPAQSSSYSKRNSYFDTRG